MTLTIILLAIAGLFTGPFLVKYSAKRAVLQPLALVENEEWQVIGVCVQNPQEAAKLWELDATDFDDEKLGETWQEIKNHCLEHVVKNNPQEKVLIENEKDVKKFEKLFPNKDLTFDVNDSSLAIKAKEKALEGSKAWSRQQLIKTASKIVEAKLDRTKLAGAGIIEKGQAGEKSWVRRESKISPQRIWFISFITSGFLALTPWFAHSLHFSSKGEALALGALLILALSGVIIALVDYDTFYIDQKIFWSSVLAVSLLVVLADAHEKDLNRLYAGSIAIIAAIFFEITNYLYKKVRGGSGMGFGDTLLLITTAGVPAMLTGSFALGWHSLLAGLLAGIVGWSVQAVLKKVNKDTPFAFGPYMVIGWAIAWIWRLV